MKRIKSNKKNRLKQSKLEEDKYLSPKQLQQYLDAVDEDFSADSLSLMDYTLFYLTFYLSDRKSESYALLWKDFNDITGCISISKALDRYSNEKSTKGNKFTTIRLPQDMIKKLLAWKKRQKIELSELVITQSSNQLMFSYCDRGGNINVPLHTDYLNYRLKSIERRHPELPHLNPHKLRHTGATLAKVFGMGMDEIQQGLTHSEISVTKEYVNAPDFVGNPLGGFVNEHLKKSLEAGDR